jgi:hypothetical protein
MDRRNVPAAERLYHAFPPAAKRASIVKESDIFKWEVKPFRR